MFRAEHSNNSESKVWLVSVRSQRSVAISQARKRVAEPKKVSHILFGRKKKKKRPKAAFVATSQGIDIEQWDQTARKDAQLLFKCYPIAYKCWLIDEKCYPSLEMLPKLRNVTQA